MNLISPSHKISSTLSFKDVTGVQSDERAFPKNLSFTVKSGGVTCLLGPSGSGKTTTLFLACGLLRQKSGEIRVSDKIVADDQTFIPSRERNVGLIFQDYALFPHMTVLENVLFGLKNDLSKRKEKSIKMLKILKMENMLERYPHTLSGGEQQRVALARSLLPGPRILLMDEPFSGLDRQSRVYLREEIIGMIKEMGVTMMIVTHDPEEAFQLCDHVILLDDGTILQQGTPENLCHHPLSAQVVSFLGDINEMKAKICEGCAVLGPLRIPFKKGRFKEGEFIHLMVRPEAFYIMNKREEHQKDRMLFPAKVRRIRCLGRILHALLDIPGIMIPLHAHFPLISHLEEGEIMVRCDERLCFLFPFSQERFLKGTF